MKIGLILHNPSPHQVALLNALVDIVDEPLKIGYMNAQNPSRQWGAPTPATDWTMVPAALPQIASGELVNWLIAQDRDVWVLSSIYTSVATHVIAYYLKKLQMPFWFMAEPPRPRPLPVSALQKMMLSRLLNQAQGLVTTGNAGVAAYQKLYLRALPAISVPYYPEDGFQTTQETRSHQPGKEIEFLVVAQLIARKGIDVLLDACTALPKTGWHLTIVGEGPKGNALKQRAHAFNGRIRFIGNIAYAERHQVFAAADVLVMPTRWDGWGMVVPEALMHGLPVISTDKAMSAMEFVRNNHNGFLGPADSPGFLARAMTFFLQQDAPLYRFSDAATASVAHYLPPRGAQLLHDTLKTHHETD